MQAGTIAPNVCFRQKVIAADGSKQQILHVEVLY